MDGQQDRIEGLHDPDICFFSTGADLANTMPEWIRAALSERLMGVSRKALAARAMTMSEGYRTGRDSSGVEDKLDVLAYASVRMPATYAATRAALGYAAELSPGFAPRSVLDVGAGPGTATWATLDLWPSIERVSLIDRNPELLELARHLAPAAGAAETTFRFDLGSLPACLKDALASDLVISSYAVTELPMPTALSAIMELWRLANAMFVIVEPGTPGGFMRLLAYRDALIAGGGRIIAPCTHESVCPLAQTQRWCHFSQRLPRSREHLAIKDGTAPFEDERFTYLAVAKTLLRRGTVRRVLATPRVSKARVSLTLCAPGETEEKAIERRSAEAYKAAKRLDWGDAIQL